MYGNVICDPCGCFEVRSQPVFKMTEYGCRLVVWRYYGRPLSVSGRPFYILPMLFYLFIYFLWPPYSPALVNGSSRTFYT